VCGVSDYRTLLLLRHAKSAYPEGVADHDRPLAERGIREAGLAGKWLRSNAPDIDLVLCSTAARARETLTRTKIEAPVEYRDRLYEAAPGEVIEEINSVNDSVSTLLVVGHEPTTSQVVLDLAGADGTDAELAEQISEKFPTSAVAVLRAAAPWSQLTLGSAALVGFHVPR
jgi:phosphohistidine phosphatase